MAGGKLLSISDCSHRMKRSCIRLFVSVLIFLSVLWASDQPSVEEYRIYSSVLEKLYVGQETKLVVISDQTSVDMLRLDSWDFLNKSIQSRRKETGIWSTAALAKMSPAAFEDFKARNKDTSNIQHASISLSVKNVTIDQATLLTKNESEYWESFYRKFPDSPGLIYVSRVGFDRTAKQALVYVGRTCGFLCGDGYLVLLEEEHGKWTIKGKYLCWVS